MDKVNNQTEKEFRDKQTTFGHIHKGANLSLWLRNEYGRDSIREKRYRAVAEKFLNGGRNLKVLEIAAGVGDFVIYCSSLFPGHQYFANELSRVQLSENINEVARYFGVKILPELSYGPVEKLTYSDNLFDVIFIKAAVHHFEDPQTGFKEMHRVLKLGGKIIFFEDPVCLDIPFYKEWKKRNFSLSERSLGLNEHIYTIAEYIDFGKLFSRKRWYLDEELIHEYDRQQRKRSGLKNSLGYIVRKWNFLFLHFMVWRFSPLIFLFEK